MNCPCKKFTGSKYQYQYAYRLLLSSCIQDAQAPHLEGVHHSIAQTYYCKGKGKVHPLYRH